MVHTDGLEAFRGWIASQVRDRVVGAATDDHAERFFNEAGPRWFDADAPIRRVHADASMFIGGLRAILLQSLHPRAMAGVAQHSDYRADPWGRLQRTAEFLAATTFGTVDQAEQAVAVVRRVHERVHGVTADGQPYSANDPHLLRWVHVAEVDSFLAAHDRYGRQRLIGPERDAYVRDTAVVARALGVVAPPESEGELRAQMRAFRPELAGTREAREAARYLLIQPPLPLQAWPAYGAIAAPAVALLPVWVRVALWLPYLPLTEAVAVGAIGQIVTRTLRWSLSPHPSEVAAEMS